MTQEEFKERSIQINAAISELMKEQRLMVNKYIEDNKEYHPGDIVMLKSKETTDSEKVFVKNVGVHDDGKLFYQFIRMKKDGTPSSHRFHPYEEFGNYSILLINSEWRNKNDDGTPKK